MSAPAFTAEQAEAVRRRSGSLLLEANAGSGKTSVLVERFVRSVQHDGVLPERMLAITFTDRAAGELRSRVRSRFLELGLRDQARETEAAWVSTVHGFCARVLRAHAIAAGLDPAFVVIDEGTARDLRDRAWEEAFGAWLDGAHGAEALALAAAYDADRLRTAIVAAHDHLRSAGHARPRLPAPGVPGDPRALRDDLVGARDAAAEQLAGAGDGLRVGEARDALERCREALATEGGPGPAGLVAARVGTGAGALRSEACERYRHALEGYAAGLRDARAGRAVARLDELLDLYAGAYATAKQTRAGVDFDDLELRARDLLARDETLRRGYAERFDRVMVDEFQDSNPLQVQLFEMLDRDTLFVVGDERQSIYGFRHADIEVFRRRRARLAAAGQVASLATNFRSRGAILDTLNATFAPRFGESFVALRAGRGDERHQEPLVELLLTDRDGWDELGAGGSGSLGALPRAAPWRQAEARLLAQRIADLVSAGAARPEQIVVLLRSLTDLPVYERALEDQGLQTLSAGGRGYWGRQVVRDLCAWLMALANPRDETALYGVLASPLVGLSSDALALVARAGSGRAWWAIQSDPALRERLAGGDRERLVAFAERFAAERELAPRLALDELIARMVSAAGYDMHVLSLPGGPRRLANVHKLQRLAAEYERDHGRDVRGLTDRATAELEADAREADAPVELGDASAVRLMSIHAAKGLEFDVVCVADLGRKPGTDDGSDLLVGGDAVGLRLVDLDGTRENALAFDALRAAARERAVAEEERVMYVALTRARERLILSGGCDPERFTAGHGQPPLSWLAPALLGGDLSRLPTAQRPDVTHAFAHGGFEARVRCVLNAPSTVGSVLRGESLAPAAAGLQACPPPSPLAPPAAAPEAPPGQLTLSYSALSAWKACGYRFYLRRVLGLPEEEEAAAAAPAAGAAAQAGPDEDAELDPLLRGSIVHALLEADDPGGAPLDLSDESPAEIGARFGVALTALQWADLARLTAAFARSGLRGRLARARAVHRERGFGFALGDTLVTGVVDVLAEEADGTALVVDYKTDRVEPGTDLEALVEADYGIQRRVYALAALQSGAARAEVGYAFLERPEQAVCARYTAADIPRLQSELRAAASGPLEGRYPVTDRPHRDLCLTCPGRRALCSHPEEITLRPRELA